MGQLRKSGAVIVDIRTPEEYSLDEAPGAINIPLEELKKRLSELPKDKPVCVYCTIGLRGYIATRLLVQRGYDAKNLSGGLRTVSFLKVSEEMPNISVSGFVNPAFGFANRDFPYIHKS